MNLRTNLLSKRRQTQRMYFMIPPYVNLEKAVLATVTEHSNWYFEAGVRVESTAKRHKSVVDCAS